MIFEPRVENIFAIRIMCANKTCYNKGDAFNRSRLVVSVLTPLCKVSVCRPFPSPVTRPLSLCPQGRPRGAPAMCGRSPFQRQSHSSPAFPTPPSPGRTLAPLPFLRAVPRRHLPLRPQGRSSAGRPLVTHVTPRTPCSVVPSAHVQETLQPLSLSPRVLLPKNKRLLSTLSSPARLSDSGSVSVILTVTLGT